MEKSRSNGASYTVWFMYSMYVLTTYVEYSTCMLNVHVALVLLVIMVELCV